MENKITTKELISRINSGEIIGVGKRDITDVKQAYTRSYIFIPKVNGNTIDCDVYINGINTKCPSIFYIKEIEEIISNQGYVLIYERSKGE